MCGRGIIVLSLEHSSRFWLQPLPAASAAAATPAAAAAPQRLILDACRNRFLMPSAVAAADGATSVAAAVPAASEAVSLSSQQGTSVRVLANHEINDLRALRSIIETAAAAMHAEYEAAHATNPATATASAPAIPASSSSRDPFAADGGASDGDSSFACASVSVLVDDVMSLVARFGASHTLAFLQTLKAAPQLRLAIMAAVDLDGLAALAPLHVGSGTANAQALHSHVGVHTHLSALASTTVSVRALRPLVGSAGALLATVDVLHKRASGKVSHVVEEVEVQPLRGLVRKVTAAAAAAAASAEERQGKSAANASTASVMQQFGASFSLDLTAKAKSARAQTVLPYQHTGQQSMSGDQQPTSSLDLVDDDIISDDDHDFDDPDDDLDV